MGTVINLRAALAIAFFDSRHKLRSVPIGV